jgi:regulator of replication initiation timing
VTNSGDSELNIDSVSVDVDWVVVDAVEPFSLEPAQSKEILLQFTADTLGQVSGNLALHSNDPKTPELLMAVSLDVSEKEVETVTVTVESEPDPVAEAEPESQAAAEPGETVVIQAPAAEEIVLDDSELREALRLSQLECKRLQAETDELREALRLSQEDNTRLQDENDELRRRLAALEAELAALKAELERVKKQLADLEASMRKSGNTDALDDMYERLEWERKLRAELAKLVKETRSRGMQTDTDEHKFDALLQRDAVREVADNRRLHKPRFLPPADDEETLAARPVKPLRWLLRGIRSIYNDKFVADAIDNRQMHPHDPLPEFIYMWTCKRFGLRDLVGTTRWDIANAVDVYGEDSAEVRLFGSFMHEEYGIEQLSFFLYCRTVVQDMSATANSTVDARQSEIPTLAEQAHSESRYLPITVAMEIVNSILGSRFTRADQEEVLHQLQFEALPWSVVAAKLDRNDSADAGTQMIGSDITVPSARPMTKEMSVREAPSRGVMSTTGSARMAAQQDQERFHDSFGYARTDVVAEQNSESWALSATQDGNSLFAGLDPEALQLAVVEESTFLLIILVAYSKQRDVYRAGLKEMFDIADGDGPGPPGAVKRPQ